MALIQCEECKNNVSDKAEKCPHCGAPVIIPKQVIKIETNKPKLKYFPCRKCEHENIENTITCPKCHTFAPNKSAKELEGNRALAKNLGWVAAPALLIVSIKAIIAAPIATSFCILVSLISFPITRKIIKGKIKFIPNVWLTVLLYMIACVFAAQSQNKIDALEQEKKSAAIAIEEKAKSEAAEIENRKKYEEYKKTSDQIWIRIKGAIDSKKYETAKKEISIISPFKKYDQKLSTKVDSANELIAFRIAKDEIPSLLKKLKEYPDDNEALRIYKRLLTGDPSNKKYEKKANELQKKIDNDKKEAEALSQAESQVKSQFSPWDGSHRGLEKYIKETMNDPASYEHVSTNYWLFKDHMVVLTKFRGKNAFGGTVTNSVKAKVSLDGSNVTILEQYQ